MATQGPTRKPPTGIMRFFFRTPIWLYRLNLGWIMGNRFLLLNHSVANLARCVRLSWRLYGTTKRVMPT